MAPVVNELKYARVHLHFLAGFGADQKFARAINRLFDSNSGVAKTSRHIDWKKMST